LRRRFGRAILFISHDLDVVELMCDRVIVLYIGRVMKIGKTVDACAPPRSLYPGAAGGLAETGHRNTDNTPVARGYPVADGAAVRLRISHPMPACGARLR
jgi:peptide/nickel transport system ATP-binding protein